jgi:hypothetical protein
MNIAKNLYVNAALAVRDERMRETLYARRAFYEHLARLASANLTLLKAFEEVEALAPGENDCGRRSILNHWPQIVEGVKLSLRTSSASAFGTLDWGRALEADTYDADACCA